MKICFSFSIISSTNAICTYGTYIVSLIWASIWFDPKLLEANNIRNPVLFFGIYSFICIVKMPSDTQLMLVNGYIFAHFLENLILSADKIKKNFHSSYIYFEYSSEQWTNGNVLGVYSWWSPHLMLRWYRWQIFPNKIYYDSLYFLSKSLYEFHFILLFEAFSRYCWSSIYFVLLPRKWKIFSRFFFYA